MSRRTKKDVINDVGDELDINITRVNPTKHEWLQILSAVRSLKGDDSD